MSTEINRATARQLSGEIVAALKEVADRHGLEVAVNGGTYGEGMYKPKVVFKTATADQDEFASWADIYGLQATDFGRTFRSKGRIFKVAGVNPRGRVRPIICDEQPNGKRYVFPADTVKAALARETQ